jgi:hypothetical protein
MKIQATWAEENIRIVKSFEKQENASKEIDLISNGRAVVGFIEVEFKKKEVIPGRVWIHMPEGFEIMDGLLADIKYPGKDKPDYIYTDPDTEVNFCFSIDPGSIDDGETEIVKNATAREMERLYPASFIHNGATLKANGKKVSYFSFTSPVLDGDLYNFMFFAENGGNLLIGTFNCPGPQKDDWAPVLPHILETLRDAESA